MKIKGHAKVELIDAKSGKVKQTVEQDNMVTEFSKEVFKDLGLLANPISRNYLSNSANSVYYPKDPITDLFGGILLFDSQITQDFDDTKKYNSPIYVPAGVQMVGNASTLLTSYSGSNFYLGLYDASNSETSENTNENKRTFIYEWGEGFANGSISSICLTSGLGGFIGTGQPINYNANNQHWEAQYEIANNSPLAPGSTRFWLRGYTNGLGNSYLNSSGSPSNRKVDGVSSFVYIDRTTLFKLITMEADTSSLLQLKDLPVDCLNNGVVTLQKINLPIKKIDPFYKQENVLTSKVKEEVVLNLHQLDNDFPANGLNVTQARVMAGINYILLAGINTTARSGNVSGRLQDGDSIYTVKLYKDNGVWKGKYRVYSNIQGITSVSVSYNPMAFSFGAPNDAVYNYFNGLILDSDFIPLDNPYRDALVLVDGLDISSTYMLHHSCYIIKTDGTAIRKNFPNKATIDFNTYSYIYKEGTESFLLAGGSSMAKDSLVSLSGRIRMPDFTYWDPITDKSYISNAYELQNWSWSLSPYFYMGFDNYNYIQLSGQGTASSTNCTSYSPTSARHLDCNWLSTISNLDSPIVKGPTDKLRITYTLTFEEEA